MQRRDLIKSIATMGGLFAVLGSVNGYIKGLRFPTLQSEPHKRPTRLSLLEPGMELDITGAYIQHVERLEGGLRIEIRAFDPQPKIQLKAQESQFHQIVIHNMSSKVQFHGGSMKLQNLDQIGPNSFSFDIDVNRGMHQITTEVPFTENFRFSVIGDSGGGPELAWCIERSRQLNADFVLHAGDIYYSQVDFDQVERHLHDSPLPIYTSIGNHDFHSKGSHIHLDFTQTIGPRNFYFVLGDSAFVSFDTAASHWPVDHGDRARLFDQLSSLNSKVKNWVLLTHRPIHDPRSAIDPTKSHTVSDFEKAWLLKQLTEITPNPVLLAGHIHIAAEHKQDGLKTYVSGDGLGSRDLVSGRRVARILLAEKSTASNVTYEWAPLEMPYTSYCHPKNRGLLKLRGRETPEGAFGPQCVG